jgi:hypothetical protein
MPSFMIATKRDANGKIIDRQVTTWHGQNDEVERLKKLGYVIELDITWHDPFKDGKEVHEHREI